MELNEVKRAYFLGIGGIGMSALARYFASKGVKVSGYDKTSSDLTGELASEGIAVHYNEDIQNVDPKADLYVFTPAIPKDHPAFEFVRSLGQQWYKRSEVLEAVSNEHKALAISGTHGKTTTSAFIAHLQNESGRGITAFVGGIMNNYNSNLILNDTHGYMVVEADEYDRSFLRLNPDIAVVTSMDPDHLDIYGTHEQMKADYRKFASQSKKLIVHYSVGNEFQHNAKLTYGTNQDANYSYDVLEVRDGAYHFRILKNKELLGEFHSYLGGRHNVENALAAVAVCAESGLGVEQLIMSIASFKGVQRRFERIISMKDHALIDDYAHHPREIEAAISAARDLFPKGKLTVVFQPHLYTRTRDLEAGFVSSLQLADEVILLPIYPARELPIAGVSSTHLLNKLSLKTKLHVEKSDLFNAVLSLSPEIVLMLGAGDIDRLVNPMAKALKDKWNAN